MNRVGDRAPSRRAHVDRVGRCRRGKAERGGDGRDLRSRGGVAAVAGSAERAESCSRERRLRDWIPVLIDGDVSLRASRSNEQRVGLDAVAIAKVDRISSRGRSQVIRRRERCQSILHSRRRFAEGNRVQYLPAIAENWLDRR